MVELPVDESFANSPQIIALTAQFMEITQVTAIPAPVDWIESVSSLKLPDKTDRRLQELMDRNNEGQLSKDETAELESLVEISEQLSLVRDEAFHLLGRKPQ